MSYRQQAIKWYDQDGKHFIRSYIQEQPVWIEENFSKSPNTLARNCGVYGIYFNGNCVYIGESSEIGCRWLTHIYNMYVNSMEYWGVDINEIKNRTVRIDMRILVNGIVDSVQREELEWDYINKEKPILQRTYEKRYPVDKAEYDSINKIWLQRDNIRPDQCIKKKYRREVMKDILGL